MDHSVLQARLVIVQAFLVASKPLLDSSESLAVCGERVEFSQATPDAAEQRAVKGSSGLRQSVEFPLAVAANLHQFGITQDGEVARDVRLELVENLAKVADTNFLLRTKKVQNPQASGVRKGAKEVRGRHIHRIEYDGGHGTGSSPRDPLASRERLPRVAVSDLWWMRS